MALMNELAFELLTVIRPLVYAVLVLDQDATRFGDKGFCHEELLE